jgi:hypothetical protein
MSQICHADGTIAPSAPSSVSSDLNESRTIRLRTGGENMKKSTLRMTVISACVGAGLALSACGGAGSAESGDTGEDTSASQEDGAEGGEAGAEDAGAAEAAVYTEDDLTAAVEAGGFEAKTADTAGVDELNSAMGEMNIEPAECEIFMNAAAAAVEDGEATVIVGTPNGGAQTTTGGAMGYPSADAAADMLSSSTGMLDSCGEMTMTMQGMEMPSSTTEVDASVDGADQVVATEIEMDVSGQTISTTSVQAQKGSAVITVSSGTGAGMEGEGIDELSAIAADMIAALP